MCGLAGLVAISNEPFPSHCEHLALEMAKAIRFRGPDHLASWKNENCTIAMGHARLSIVDLSEAGYQPMKSPSGRYTIALNGEIYNFRAIRKALGESSVPWRGHSDTEVLLAAVERWGLERTLVELEGMFAFALYDATTRKLHLVRDRIGEKPLYYGWVGTSFVFASQVSALYKHPGWTLAVDRDAIVSLLRYGNVPAPRSIYAGIWKLEAGCVLSLDVPLRGRSLDRPRRYWSLLDVALNGKDDVRVDSDENSITELDSLLRDVVRDEMTSDVPVGVFLSGGIDSSLIAALAQSVSNQRVRTFSIGFQEAAYDEATNARRVAEHIGADHCQLYLTAADALGVVKDLPNIYDEPFADASQIPTYLLAKLARREVTVALSGDGGDEMFGGYTRHIWADVLFAASQRIPTILLRHSGHVLSSISSNNVDHLYRIVEPFLPEKLRQTGISHKVAKLGAVLNASTTHSLYSALTMQWDGARAAVIGSTPDSGPIEVTADLNHPLAPAERIMLEDTHRYLPDDILVKVDRAAMFCSLETRAPYVHPRVVEFSWRIPLSRRIRHHKGKWILRELLSRYVPRELFERPKQGFGLPIRDWLRGPLREWGESLLDRKRINREGYLVSDSIIQKWDEHISGRRNWEYMLWNVLMFQQWLEVTRQR